MKNSKSTINIFNPLNDWFVFDKQTSKFQEKSYDRKRSNWLS